MRRTHLRGHENILKRLLVHSGALNLGLLMRQAFGVGTPRGLQAGVGYGYQESDRGTWIGMLGGDVRVGRSLKLVAEGYVWQEGDGFLMGGVRLFGSRLSADLGVITTMDGDDTFVFPVVNVVWTF